MPKLNFFGGGSQQERIEHAHENLQHEVNSYKDQARGITDAVEELKNNPQLASSVAELVQRVKEKPQETQKLITDWVKEHFGENGDMRPTLDSIAEPILNQNSTIETIRYIQNEQFKKVKDEWDAKVRNALYSAIITTIFDFITPDVLPFVGGFVEGGLDTVITGAVSLAFKLIGGAEYEAPSFGEYATVWIGETLVDLIPGIGDLANFGLSGFANASVLHFFAVQRKRREALQKAEEATLALN